MTTIPKRTKDTDVASEVAQGRAFRQQVIKLAEEAATRFMQGEPLNDILAAIANRDHLNRLQIQRLVEETNTVAYNKRYDLVRKDKDRRISFELAELSKVIERMGASAPPEIENPNWVTGEPGEGEMTKAAGVTTQVRHNANANIDAKRQFLMEKKASAAEQQTLAQWEQLQRSIQSGIFKVANSLVMTERTHKKGNALFNTMLDDASLSDDLVEGIRKKASEIAKTLVDTRHAHAGFMVSLEVKATEKVASLLLGEYSFLKTAGDSSKLAPPKMTPTSDISTYQQLVDLAKKLQAEQQVAHSMQNSAKAEVLS